MNLYFSDTHFNHRFMSNQRRFKNVDMMNQYIIDGICSRSTDDDILYCLGDFVWEGSNDYIERIINQLNFKKLIFIKGNHDEPLINFLNQSKDSRLELHTDMFIKDGEHHIHLYHYPIFDWNYKYHNQWHLYGHQHEIRSEGVEMMNLPYSHNVNVEFNEYIPVSINDIVKKYMKF